MIFYLTIIILSFSFGALVGATLGFDLSMNYEKEK